jgi:hypothetical protein
MLIGADSCDVLPLLERAGTVLASDELTSAKCSDKLVNLKCTKSFTVTEASNEEEMCCLCDGGTLVGDARTGDTTGENGDRTVDASKQTAAVTRTALFSVADAAECGERDSGDI